MMRNEIVPLTRDCSPRRTTIFGDEDVVFAHIRNTDEDSVTAAGTIRARIKSYPSNANDIAVQARSIGGIHNVCAYRRKAGNL